MTKEAEALVSVTQTMLRLWYNDNAMLTVGDISRATHQCVELFQFINPDDKELAILQSTVELCRRLNITF